MAAWYKVLHVASWLYSLLCTSQQKYGDCYLWILSRTTLQSVVFQIMSVTMMTKQWNLLKIKKMIGVVSNFLWCRLRASQHVTVLSSKVCGVHTAEQVLDQQLIRPEQPEEEEEENAEDRVTFLDTLNSVEEATKYTCHFDIEDNIIIMCNKTENWLLHNFVCEPAANADGERFKLKIYKNAWCEHTHTRCFPCLNNRCPADDPLVLHNTLCLGRFNSWSRK